MQLQRKITMPIHTTKTIAAKIQKTNWIYPASTLPPDKRQLHYFGVKSLRSIYDSQKSQPSNDF